jgi:hypothetical protein
MNKNVTSLLVMAIVAMFLLTMGSLFWLEQMPEVKYWKEVSSRLSTFYNLDKATIARSVDRGVVKYRVTFRCKAAFRESRDKLMDDIGRYVWNNRPDGKQPAEVWVIYQTEEGSGCARRVENYRKQVSSPKPGATK